jgi:hypothetical protein
MTRLIGTLVVSAAIVLAPALAAAQDGAEWQTEAAPQTPQPERLPPAPPAGQPPAPQAQTTSQVPPGQWVWTQQYGWIWMPYADAYTQVPANGYGQPYAYVYAPAYGCWAWLAAPWVWGIGPWPVFGVYGPARFAWYGHGWWRYPGSWHYAPGYAGYGHPYGGGWHYPQPVPHSRPVPYARPVPYRAGSASFRGSMAPAPHLRAPAPVGHGGGSGFARPQGGGRSGGGRGGHGHGRG